MFALDRSATQLFVKYRIAEKWSIFACCRMRI